MRLPTVGPSAGVGARARPMLAGALIALLGCALVWAGAVPAEAQSVPFKPGKKPPPPGPPATAKPKKGPPRQGVIVDSEAPPGFEKLLKPQRTLVDVFHANRRIGQTFAVFKPGRLRFEKPAAVVKLVGVRKSRRSLVLKALSGWLETNVDRLCSQTIRTQSCGALSPKVAGIIFNEARLKVTVFVKTAYLSASDKWRSKFLRSPSKNVSFLSQFDGALAGQSQRASSRFDSNLRMLNLLGWRDFRLRGQTNTSPSMGMQVETLAVEWDRRGIAARGGVIRSTGSSLLPQVTLYGGHVGTSGNTRLDLDQAFGSQLSVFLRQQAIVEIIRDGRVLSARFYPSGNQLLDTSNLPGGAYPVTIRIRETDGTVREETRFFSKSSQIPPKDMPLLFAEGGVVGRVRESGMPERSQLPYVNFGGRVRVLDNLALGAQFSATDSEAAGEANLFFLTRFFRFNVSAVRSSKGDWGVAGGLSASYGSVHGGVNARYVRGPGSRVDNPTSPATFRFIGERALQVSARLSWRVKDIDFGVSATVTKLPGSGLNWTINPRARVPVWEKNGHSVTFVGDASIGNTDIQVLGKIVYRWRRPKSLVIAEAGARYRRAADGAQSVSDIAAVGGAYKLPDFRGHKSSVRGELRRDNSRNQINTEARTTGPFGRYTASASHSRGGGSANTSFAAIMSVGLAIDRKGIAVGGRSRTESAVIIKIRGADEKAKFHVLVDGQPRHVFTGDTTKPIFLRAYEKYLIAIRPVVVDRERSFANVDTSAREVILYPGTVRTMAWQVVQVYVVFGRAVGPGDKPVANAEIKGVNGVAETDGRGYFQAEIKSTSRELRFLDGKGRACVARLKKVKPRNGFAKLGDVACAWRYPVAGKKPNGKKSDMRSARNDGAPRRTRSFLPPANKVRVSGILLTFGNSLEMAGEDAAPANQGRSRRKRRTPAPAHSVKVSEIRMSFGESLGSAGRKGMPKQTSQRRKSRGRSGKKASRRARGARRGHAVRIGGITFKSGATLD